MSLEVLHHPEGEVGGVGRRGGEFQHARIHQPACSLVLKLKSLQREVVWQSQSRQDWESTALWHVPQLYTYHGVGELLLLASHEDLWRENHFVARVDVGVANGLCRVDAELGREGDAGLLRRRSQHRGEKTRE